MQRPPIWTVRSLIAGHEPPDVYDERSFFTAYSKLREADAGLNSALEQPALRRRLPDVRGLDVVDLGCGTGELARLLAARRRASSRSTRLRG
jgi:ubiquinone/menaquinone biosynthesis C-methylase UbiE